MNHYKSVEFLSNFQNFKPPCTNVKHPCWRLSGDGSIESIDLPWTARPDGSG